MKKNLMVLLTALLLAFTAMPALPSAAEVTVAQEDATYELPFTVLKEDADEASVAGNYVQSPAEVKVEDGKSMVYIMLLDSQYWQSLKVQDGDDFVEAEVVSENEEENTRLVKFELKDVEKTLNAKAHIIVTGIPGLGEYNQTHDIRFQFDASEVPAEEETEVDEETPEAPAASLEDGDYTVDFKVLHEEKDDVSRMGSYMETPAALTVEEGKQVVSLTLTDNETITEFQIEQDGEFVDATVVNEDEEANTRTVSFEVADLSEIMNAKVTVFVAAMNHTGNYTVRLAFDQDSVEPAVTETPETPEAPETSLENGEYTIGFKVLHEEEDEVSRMGSYMVAPAALTVEEGKQVVELTLTDNETITEFQVEQDGEFVDATVVAVDEEANTRTVSFEVADFSEIMNAKVTVYVAAMNHTGNYTVRLAFDQDSVEAVANETPETPEQPEEEVTVSFKDIDNTWAKPYIEALAAQEIVKGKTPETFAPQDSITRKQFALIIARALDLETQEYQGTFSDLTADMKDFVLEVEAANRAGIITGDNGKFNPNEVITRQQMAAMIIRAIEYKDASLLDDVATDVVFADAATVSDYAKEAVELAAGLGIIDGKVVKGQQVFEPKAQATRAHAVKMVYNMLETIQ